MRLLMLFVDGFEDTEAIATKDVLLRGGDEVVCASLMGRKEIKPKFSDGLLVSDLIEDVDYKQFDGVIIPGGPGSFKIMPSKPIIPAILKYFAENNKLIAAICAAPFLVGREGLLNGRNFTVHPGFENYVIGGNYLRSNGVVRDGNFITAKSMFYSIEFGLTIHEYFHGKESRDALCLACQGEGN